MARTIRKSAVKQVPLSTVKDDLSRYLREAKTREIVITRHGKPAGVLIGFESEEDWFEYRLENDPRFLRDMVPNHLFRMPGHALAPMTSPTTPPAAPAPRPPIACWRAMGMPGRRSRQTIRTGNATNDSSWEVTP
jgi:prevent-host-death family protein